MGKYDLTARDVVERFEGEIPIDKDGDWNIGVIYGNSGTGKTQIAKHLFPDEYIGDLTYTGSCVLEDFPSDVLSDDIARAMNSVGFTTAKSWLKPYSVLSNGEKMRVDLARTVLDKRELVVFDEFTSVVDRKVAKVGSFAVQRAVRKLKRKFVAVTCHEDILEWLEPDWTFCTDDMRFTSTRGALRRPSIQVDIGELKGYWPVFRKYHYMNYNILGGSHQFVAFYEGEPIAFCAITHLVHNGIMNAKRMHRLVVLPDYQGIGIGGKLFDHVARLYHERGHRVFARFSHPALVALLDKNKDWRLNQNVSRAARHAGGVGLAGSGSHRRLTTGWEYKPT
jgi:GNAT superfamily N-acetyltransferase